VFYSIFYSLHIKVGGFVRTVAPTPVIRTADQFGAGVDEAGRGLIRQGGRFGDFVLTGSSNIFHGIGDGFDSIIAG